MRDPSEEDPAVLAAEFRVAASAQMARAEAIAADVLRNPPFATPAAQEAYGVPPVTTGASAAREAYGTPPGTTGTYPRPSLVLPQPMHPVAAARSDVPAMESGYRALSLQHDPTQAQPTRTAAMAVPDALSTAAHGASLPSPHPHPWNPLAAAEAGPVAAAALPRASLHPPAQSPLAAAEAGLVAAAAIPRASAPSLVTDTAAGVLRSALAAATTSGHGAVSEEIILLALRQAGAPGLEQYRPDAQWNLDVPDIILDTVRAIVEEGRVEEFFPGLIASAQARGMHLHGVMSTTWVILGWEHWGKRISRQPHSCSCQVMPTTARILQTRHETGSQLHNQLP